jgi:hypothetical protein
MPPLLDVSEALVDPDLTDLFDVVRRMETINPATGRSQQVSETTRSVVGVICAANPNDLDRLDDMQRMGRHLTLVTKFRLIGPAPGKQPDLVTWKGDSYVVKAVDPYPQYGDGFVQVILGSIDIIDQPTPEPETDEDN